MAATTCDVIMEARDTLDASRLVGRLKMLVPSAAAEADAAHASKNWITLAAAVTNNTEALLAYKPPAHADTLFLYLFACIRRFSVDSELFEAVSSQADRIAEADGVDGARKVKLLSHLYNLTENRGGSKLHVLLRLFEVAAATGEAGKLTRFLAQVDTVAGRWGLCKADERRVLLSAAALASSTGDELRAQQLRISFLQTFHGEAELAAARTMAIKAAISYAQAPYASHNAAVVSLHAVKALAADSDATVATLSRLIGLLADGSVAELAAFMSSSGPVLASLSVDVEATLSAKRLVAIAALGGAHGTVTFADVAAAIQCEEAEAEHWVLRAVDTGNVTAIIDQPARTVAISPVGARAVTGAEWVHLKAALASRRAEVDSVLASIKATSA